MGAYYLNAASAPLSRTPVSNMACRSLASGFGRASGAQAMIETLCSPTTPGRKSSRSNSAAASGSGCRISISVHSPLRLSKKETAPGGAAP
jgi:hypothetical protein